jgi:hypothetical protein
MTRAGARIEACHNRRQRRMWRKAANRKPASDLNEAAAAEVIRAGFRNLISHAVLPPNR